MNIEDIKKVVQEESKKTRDELKSYVNDESKKTRDELKSYIKTGLEKIDEKIDLVDKNITSQINGINNRIDDYAINKVSYDNFNPIVKRVEVLEQKVGI